MKRFITRALFSGLLLFGNLCVQSQIPPPKDVLGFTPGDDRKLASWAQIVDYFKKLDAASDRVIVEEIGKSTMGAPFIYATISSPENLKRLDEIKDINNQLADPRLFHRKRGLPETYAKNFIRNGKTIVMITCGIHSTEVGSTLSSMLIAHQLALVSHPDVKKILDNTIILLVPSLNPDGVDIVKNWYDKTLGTPYEGTEPPELYHKYIGHDNNRDWYAFTQVETQLTVDKIHNVWHPQIVHDIHQQGQNGSRLFLPPYMRPVEPNVPKQIVEGYTDLGNFMAGKMRQMGFQGITTNSTYDAWTPARAYSHYHGGVRILSETASARLATPVTIDFERLRVPADDGYDPKVESANFGPVWRGGEWKLKNITDYMTGATHALLYHAAENRETWLRNFYEIGEQAVRVRKPGEPRAFILSSSSDPDREKARLELIEILIRGGVEGGFASERELASAPGKEITLRPLSEVTPLEAKGLAYVVPLEQPYGAFAKALLEKQVYPDLKDANGNPLPPYDVTAHTLPLLMNVEARLFVSSNRFSVSTAPALPRGRTFTNCLCATPTRESPQSLALFKSAVPSMDEGWTRWIMEGEHKKSSLCCHRFSSIDAKTLKEAKSLALSAIVFPDQSAAQIMNGYAKGSMPDEYTGGVGKEGVENLKRFVEAGGTLIFMNRSSQFAIDQFNLPVKDVTRGVARKDFYIPGSILRTELDIAHPIAKGMPKESIAWFENSPAFEVQTDPLVLTNNFRIIARYPSDPKKILLSGWALGAEKLAGKAAAVEFTLGKGKIVLFGFRPQYRGQSLATFPLLFNAISQ